MNKKNTFIHFRQYHLIMKFIFIFIFIDSVGVAALDTLYDV